MTESKTLIHLENVFFAYPDGRAVLNNLQFDFYKNDKIGLMGANGTGKTTLFHVIMGLRKPDKGSITLFGKPVSKEKHFAKVRHRIGLLFQDADDQLFCPTVLEDVTFGPLNLGLSKKEATRIAKETLTSLGLAGYEERITHKLSGGEKRMVSLATVLAMKPEALLLDEPTTGLDDQTKARLTEVLQVLDISRIVISHDFDFLSKVTEGVYLMEDGKIITDADIHVHQHVHAHAHGAHRHEHK
ncbi:MAG: energy-coupling factor ABC transporter ATP-binding protein [Desulfobacterales bacterium]|nr:energy-coupling factor ABC transporter ATP-binding protein [Desulfobacterales bacterium]